MDVLNVLIIHFVNLQIMLQVLLILLELKLNLYY